MNSLTREAAEHPHVFARAFNSGDPAAVEAVYETDGLLVPTPGHPVAGTARAEANKRLMDLGLRSRCGLGTSTSTGTWRC